MLLRFTGYPKWVCDCDQCPGCASPSEIRKNKKRYFGKQNTIKKNKEITLIKMKHFQKQK